MRVKVSFILSILLLLITQTHSRPQKRSMKRSLSDSEIKSEISQTDFYKHMGYIFEHLETLFTTDLTKLFNKINSLSVMTELLTRDQLTLGAPIEGSLQSSSYRCSTGFRSVPGDNMCYYFSNYKLPWQLAREQCFQLGGKVEPLTLETTKRQYIISHLIQSHPDTREIKRWWTGGIAIGAQWVWAKKFDRDPFSFDLWVNDKPSPTQGQCVMLDSEYYYQWRTSRCDAVYRGAQLNRNSGTYPEHHFICQRQAEFVNSPAQNMRNFRLEPVNNAATESSSVPDITSTSANTPDAPPTS